MADRPDAQTMRPCDRPRRRLPRSADARAALAAELVLTAGVPIEAATAVRVPGAPGCRIFPSTNVWNKRVDSLPVRTDSETLKAIHRPGRIAASGLRLRTAATASPGTSSRPARRVGRVSFQWPDESDRVKYPIPSKPRIEGGSDRHMLLIDKSACKLYELFAAQQDAADGTWQAGSGAVWNLGSNHLRPSGWTSADAAGLPILPGLVRYDEVAAGAILHALRFTAPTTRTRYIYPARHQAGDSSSSDLPPMGLRVRLKASVDISGFPRQARVLLTALKRYGMILADNGSPWYVTGAPDPHWNDDAMHTLRPHPRVRLRGRGHQLPAQRLTASRPADPGSGLSPRRAGARSRRRARSGGIGGARSPPRCGCAASGRGRRRCGSRPRSRSPRRAPAAGRA